MQTFLTWSSLLVDERRRLRASGIRAGVVQRFSRTWRAEALYIWDEARDSIDTGFTTSDNLICAVIQVTIRRTW